MRTRTWEALPDMRQARRACAAWVAGGCVVVAGGRGLDNEELDSVEVLDGGAWRTVPGARLPRPVTHAACALAPR